MSTTSTRKVGTAQASALAFYAEHERTGSAPYYWQKGRPTPSVVASLTRRGLIAHECGPIYRLTPAGRDMLLHVGF